MKPRQWTLFPLSDLLHRPHRWPCDQAFLGRRPTLTPIRNASFRVLVPLTSITTSQLPPFCNNSVSAPVVHRAYSRSSQDKPENSEGTPQAVPEPPPNQQQVPPTNPPPLPVQPVNIPGGPPATFSITNNPSLDAALTTVIGLGLGR